MPQAGESCTAAWAGSQRHTGTCAPAERTQVQGARQGRAGRKRPAGTISRASPPGLQQRPSLPLVFDQRAANRAGTLRWRHGSQGVQAELLLATQHSGPTGRCGRLMPSTRLHPACSAAPAQPGQGSPARPHLRRLPRSRWRAGSATSEEASSSSASSSSGLYSLRQREKEQKEEKHMCKWAWVRMPAALVAPCSRRAVWGKGGGFKAGQQAAARP